MSHRDPIDDNQLEPAATVIRKCGDGSLSAGIKVAAGITGLDESSVRRWMMAPEKAGTGGYIPSRHQQVILDWGEPRGLIEPRDFFSRAPGAGLTGSGATRAACA